MLPAIAVFVLAAIAGTPQAQPNDGARAPSAKDSNVVSPGDGVVEPRVVRLGEARPTNRGGTVHILALVSETGSLLEVKVTRSSSDARVDEAATAALKSSQFTGATKDGKPVKMWKTFTVTVKAA